MSNEGEGNGFTRPRYFSGQMLNAEDFQAEQDYHNGKRKLLNRCLYGARIACGLVVEAGKRSARINPGLALDCAGNEVYLPEPARMKLPDKDGTYFLSIVYTETEAGMVPYVMGEISGETEATRIQEGYEFSWEVKDYCAGHPEKKKGWEACGNPHPVPLARIRLKKGKVKIKFDFSTRIDTGGKDR